ncbi:hypothetical protein Fot_11060 [Forsythia ovata]|uniref:Uncharacterized protein n=1 Tax=Forsythia ovata TaxID=205694 RepID=A0ABD1WMD0_9LAMI
MSVQSISVTFSIHELADHIIKLPFGQFRALIHQLVQHKSSANLWVVHHGYYLAYKIQSSNRYFFTWYMVARIPTFSLVEGEGEGEYSVAAQPPSQEVQNKVPLQVIPPSIPVILVLDMTAFSPSPPPVPQQNKEKNVKKAGGLRKVVAPRRSLRKGLLMPRTPLYRPDD